MDAQYKTELKDLADVYFGRFRAERRSEVSGLRAEMLKWMFVFWVGNVAATVGIVFTAIRLGGR